ncbi:MAG: hypothetical protein HRU19_07785 [Pseudobacteriovorax sp.]|nr:hypothetical protein [Pseudobacteriovorax sp.]
MTFIPDKHLNGRNLIAQFILLHRKRGLFLPYSEYSYIDKWLALAESDDQLLLVLSDIIPYFYKARADWTHPPSLKLVDQKICRILMAKSRRRLEL